MVTRTVVNTGDPVVVPNGPVKAGVALTFQLVDAVKRDPISLFDAASDGGEFIIGEPVVATTNEVGLFTVDLWPNSRGEAATLYKVTSPGLFIKPFYIRVAEGETELTLLAAKAAQEAVQPQVLSLFEALLANILDIAGTATAVVTTTVNGLMSYTDKVKLDAITGTNTGNETATTIGALINGATAKATPVAADRFGFWDSVGNVMKHCTLTNLLAIFSPFAGPGADTAFLVGALTSTSTASANHYFKVQGVSGYNTGILGRTAAAFTGGFVIDPNGDSHIYNSALAAQTVTFLNTGTILIGTASAVTAAKFQVAGGISSTVHNTHDLGTTAVRYKDLWLQSGAFNASDARLKTAVSPMSTAEITAALQLAEEIGTYQWLAAVEEKGTAARLHTGMTVQRAILIMAANGLDPFRYGFIGYDQWEDKFFDHPAIAASEAQDGMPAVEGREAWTEKVLSAGDAFSFRSDELAMFILRGLRAQNASFEARLAALENR